MDVCMCVDALLSIVNLFIYPSVIKVICEVVTVKITKDAKLMCACISTKLLGYIKVIIAN